MVCPQLVEWEVRCGRALGTKEGLGESQMLGALLTFGDRPQLIFLHAMLRFELRCGHLDGYWLIVFQARGCYARFIQATAPLMPRHARVSIPGLPWHIIQRGHNRIQYFYNTEDYGRYLDDLTEQSHRFECAVHSNVLMTNHVHLLVTPTGENSAAHLMKIIGQRHARYINRIHGRTGTLWEGRYRSCLVQSEEYVLACYRDLELNPVRAATGKHPGEYRWLSHAANAEGHQDAVITPHALYLGLGLDQESRRPAYRDLLGTYLSDDVSKRIRFATLSNSVL